MLLGQKALRETVGQYSEYLSETKTIIDDVNDTTDKTNAKELENTPKEKEFVQEEDDDQTFINDFNEESNKSNIKVITRLLQ